MNWELALAGGVLIGLASALLLWADGRIAGISGIAGSLLDYRQGDVGWRVAFLVGLIGAAGLYMAWVPGAMPRQGYPAWMLIIGGLLVGFGTSMAKGCTSGHGVCGLGRRSARSLVAVLTFMTTAIVTTYVVRHLG